MGVLQSPLGSSEILSSLETPEFSLRERSKVAYPSVGAVLGDAGLGFDFSTIPPQVLEKARQRGNDVHEWVERAALPGWEGWPIHVLSGVAPEDARVREMVDEVVELVKLAGFELCASEVPMHAPVELGEPVKALKGLCGVVDWTAVTRDDKPAVIDIKTSAKLERSWVGLQTMAYSMMVRHHALWLHEARLPVVKRFVVHAPYKGRAKLIKLTDDGDLDDLVGAVRIHARKQRYGQ